MSSLGLGCRFARGRVGGACPWPAQYFGGVGQEVQSAQVSRWGDAGNDDGRQEFGGGGKLVVLQWEIFTYSRLLTAPATTQSLFFGTFVWVGGRNVWRWRIEFLLLQRASVNLGEDEDLGGDASAPTHARREARAHFHLAKTAVRIGAPQVAAGAPAQSRSSCGSRCAWRPRHLAHGAVDRECCWPCRCVCVYACLGLRCQAPDAMLHDTRNLLPSKDAWSDGRSFVFICFPSPSALLFLPPLWRRRRMHPAPKSRNHQMTSRLSGSTSSIPLLVLPDSRLSFLAP